MEEKKELYNKVYLWLFAGLMVTFLTGYYTSTNKDALEVIFSNGTFWIFPVIEVVLAIVLSVRIQKLSGNMAKFLYLLYTFISGLTFSSIFIVYKVESILWIFLIASILFLVFAALGHFLKIDITKFGSLLMMLLLGVVLASIINIFVGSEQLDLGLTILSLIVFMVYIIYDIQKVKQMDGVIKEENLPILAAFQLYLDMINIIIDLLRLFGESKD